MDISKKLRSKTDELKGQAKEAAASAVGDDELKKEGQKDQDVAAMRRGFIGKGHRSHNAKTKQLDEYRTANTDKALTGDTGAKVPDDQRTLRAGRRGPTLLQDAHFYRKQSHFSRERIPEKVVHARGFGVHGEFELQKSLSEVTKAHFLQKPGTKTPVFVRFSNFIGSKGSKDTAIDVRGLATKFYTQEGNYDSLALSLGVFILNDAMKFADFVHAVKPNPVTDVPQAAAAHDTMWDYVVNNQESAHMIMWLMSMRGRPRSWRMMEAWPINTFRLVNAQGKSTFARFVWKPALGVHGLLLEEANIIGGVDPDYHRHDIIEAIQNGADPTYALGVQLIADEDEYKYDFDVLDDTKFWPEETVPVEIVGTMTLNRLVDNFFAEQEQASFDPATLVPGIEFTNDPVLQGRSFAYRDTDYHRLGTGNINDIPINRPIAEANHNQRDGYSKYRVDTDYVAYHGNSLADDSPAETPPEYGGYFDYPEPVEGRVTREVPGDAFDDHFSQARLFWNSMSAVEKADLIKTFSYHLGKVKAKSVRQQTVDMFVNVDRDMAAALADSIGVDRPKGEHVAVTGSSPALSMANTPHSALSQRVGVLIGDGFDDGEVKATIDLLERSEVVVHVISDKIGTLIGADGMHIEADETFITSHPTLFDSYYVVGGRGLEQTMFDEHIAEFCRQAYKFFKPIGVATSGQPYLQLVADANPAGVVMAADNPDFGQEFLAAIAQQRFWER